MIRRLLVVMIFIAVLLAGCGGESNNDEYEEVVTPSYPEAPQEETPEAPIYIPASDLTIAHSYPEGSPQVEFIEQIALPEVVKEYPGLSTSIVYIDKNSQFDEIYRLLTEGTPPDVVFWNVFTMEALCNSVADLNSEQSLIDLVGEAFYQRPDGTPVGTIDAEFLRMQYGSLVDTMDEKWLGVPINMSVQVLVYNPELMTEYGLAPPSDLNGFWSAIETITKDSGGKTAGFMLPEAGLMHLAPFALSEGGELWNDEGKTVGYLDSGKNENIFEKLALAVDNKQIIFAKYDEKAFWDAPALTPEMGITAHYSDFVKGKAAMTIAYTSDLILLSELFPDFKFETAPFPAGSAGSVSMYESQFVSVLLTSPPNDLPSTEPFLPQPPVSDSATAPMREAATFIKSILSSADIMEANPIYPVPEATRISLRPIPMFYSYYFEEVDGGILSTFNEITAGKRTTAEILSELAVEWDKRLF